MNLNELTITLFGYKNPTLLIKQALERSESLPESDRILLDDIVLYFTKKETMHDSTLSFIESARKEYDRRNKHKVNPFRKVYVKRK